MFISKKSIARHAATVGLLSAMVFGSVPAFAADQVTQSITASGGALTASIADLALEPVAFQYAARPVSGGSMTLTAADGTGAQLGWNVTVLTSAFVYSGTSDGISIPPENFSLVLAGTPTLVGLVNQPVDPSGGPKVPTVSPSGTLNSARKVVQANSHFGNGAYTQPLQVNLSIPANSSAGLYTGTLTTTIASGVGL